MKKFASLLLMVLLLAAMLTVFAFPAFAEEAPTEIVPFFPIPNKPGTLSITTNGNYILNKDCVLNNITVDDDVTLTIAKGVTVTIDHDLFNCGTLNVCGTLIISDKFYNNKNDGTINVFACCGGKIVGPSPTNARSATFFTQNEHNFADDKCACGTYKCEATGNHNLESGVCSICNKKGCEIGEFDHNFVDGVCSICNAKGCEIGELDHNFVDGVCSVCNAKGCEIGELDHNFVDGVCSVCDKHCDHEWDAATGKCTVCQYECPHDGNICVVCGANIHGGEVDAGLGLGSTLSEGNITIIVGIAAFVLGLGVMFIVMKKKETA